MDSLLNNINNLINIKNYMHVLINDGSIDKDTAKYLMKAIPALEKNIIKLILSTAFNEKYLFIPEVKIEIK